MTITIAGPINLLGSTTVNVYTAPVTGPGTATLAYGDTNAGFYGEVAYTSFISGSALASLVGITTGTLVNDTTAWLKFSFGGKTLFTPKKQIRHSTPWNDISSANCVSGARTIVVGGLTYKIRLMKCDTTNPTDTPGDATAETSKLIGQIIQGGTWNVYPIGDLGYSESGSYQWFQETSSASPTTSWAGIASTTHPSRINNFYYYNPPANDNTSNRGWKPVLELV